MLVSRNVFHVVSALQSFVFVHFFWLIGSLVDATLAALIICCPLQFNLVTQNYQRLYGWRSITWSLFTLKASYLIKWAISTWSFIQSFMQWCQFIFETRPSSLENFGTPDLQQAPGDQRLPNLDTGFCRLSRHFLASSLKGVKFRVPRSLYLGPFSLFKNSTLADKIQFTFTPSLCTISSSFWWHTSCENIDTYRGTNQHTNQQQQVSQLLSFLTSRVSCTNLEVS